MRCGSRTPCARASARTMRRSPLMPARFAVFVAASAIWLAGGAHAEPAVKAVGPVGITVADIERSVAFYSVVLGFETVSDGEVWGGDYERLQGVFGVRMRGVPMRLGDESIELTEYLTPRG